jgi:hypothetical protein
MNRRLAISVLTLVALLWQGAVSAAMASSMLAMGAAAAATHSADADQAMAGMPCHQMAGMQADAAADGAADQAALPDCCAGGHCLCAAACGSAALPSLSLQLALLPTPPPLPALTLTAVVDRSPPHPFRPPIAPSV